MSRFRDTSLPAESVGDVRYSLWKILELAAGVALVALLARFFLFQSFAVASPDMAGTLLPGDRLFVNRWIYRFKAPAPGDVMLFRHPLQAGEFSLKRCVAGPGSAVEIGEKKITVDGRQFRFPPTARPGGALVVESRFSPRDSVPAFRIPRPGESVSLDSLSLAGFDFCLNLIRQENPEVPLRATADLLINDTLNNDFRIDNFRTPHRLPDGRIDFDALDWRDLNNVLNFLSARGDSARYAFRRTLFMAGAQVRRYQVKEPCYFLVGDNWEESFDGRFFGFVSRSLILGRASLVYWPGSGGERRWGRVFKWV